MMAARSGAESVYAVEVNRTMVAMSRDILAANGMSERVKLLHSLSTSLSVPRDIPQRSASAYPLDGYNSNRIHTP